jgi:hypothetical protein
MLKIIHPVSGALTILTISTFWLSTALSDLFGSRTIVVAVKTAIPWGFLLLIPALAATGASGFALAKGRRAGLIGAKIKRMPFIAANGLLVLIPSALFLASKATAGEFDASFDAMQALAHGRGDEYCAAQPQHAGWPQNESLAPPPVRMRSARRKSPSDARARNPAEESEFSCLGPEVQKSRLSGRVSGAMHVAGSANGAGFLSASLIGSLCRLGRKRKGPEMTESR